MLLHCGECVRQIHKTSRDNEMLGLLCNASMFKLTNQQEQRHNDATSFAVIYERIQVTVT